MQENEIPEFLRFINEALFFIAKAWPWNITNPCCKIF